MKKPTITLSKIEQEFDLKELFGVDLSEDESLKQAIGQVMIDQMLARIDDGRGIGGVKLKSPYSKVYSESLEFKAAGKSKNKVNMKLTGDMLAAIDIVSTRGNKIVIGINEDEVPKAYNHQTGDTVTKRPFFGFTKGELNDIVSEFKPQIKQAVKDGEDAISILVNDLIDQTNSEGA